MNNLLSKILLTLLSTVTVSTLSLSAAPAIPLQDLLIDIKPDIGFNPGDLVLNPDATLTPTVVVPNSFSAGDVARATDVNQNFAALESAVNNNTSGIDWVSVSYDSAFIDSGIILTNKTELAEVTLNVPSDGMVSLQFMGTVMCTNGTYRQYFSKIPVADEATGIIYLVMPDHTCNGNRAASVKSYVYEVEKGVNTFYLIGLNSNGGGEKVKIKGNVIATFYSRRY